MLVSGYAETRKVKPCLLFYVAALSLLVPFKAISSVPENALALDAIATVVEVIAKDWKPETVFALDLSRADIDYVQSRLRTRQLLSENEMRSFKGDRKRVGARWVLVKREVFEIS